MKRRSNSTNLIGKFTESQLITGCLAADVHCQQTLYKHYSPVMFAICLRYAKDYHSAEDILQEGFLKVFRYLNKFRAEGSFEGWMKRIFVNTAIEHYRKNVSMYPITELFQHPAITQHASVLNKLAKDELMGLIDRLAIGYKTVFNLYVIEGYPHREIAKLLDISEGTSKSQLARARYHLQRMIEERRAMDSRQIQDESYG